MESKNNNQNSQPNLGGYKLQDEPSITNDPTWADVSEFHAPKIPIAWVATTFISPALVIVLPSFFNADQPITTRVIIALSLLSVLLFVLFLMTYLRLYNAMYASQVFSLKQYAMSKRIERVERNLDARDEAASTKTEQPQEQSKQ